MRLFVGIAMPPGLKAELAAQIGALRRRLPRARWVAAENLHLTLYFLGETEESDLPAISAALQPAFARRSPFSAQLAEAGWFPPGRGARVLWIGLEDGAAVRELQSEVAEELAAALELQPEARPYHPHLTVARCSRPWPRRAAEAWAEAFPSTVGEPFEVVAGHLYRSRLGREGAIYEIVQSYPLENGP